MTTLHNSTLDSEGTVSIEGTLSKTLNNAFTILSIEGNLDVTLQDSQSTNLSGFYYVNWYINEYFMGKGLSSESQDYRGYYFQKNFQVMYEKEVIPDWILIYEGKQYN